MRIDFIMDQRLSLDLCGNIEITQKKVDESKRKTKYDLIFLRHEFACNDNDGVEKLLGLASNKTLSS